MKIFLRHTCLIVFLAMGLLSAFGTSSSSYTSRVTVKVDPNNLEAGSVAVKHAKTTVSGLGSKSYSHEKDGGDPTYPNDYGQEKSDEYTTEGGTNRAEHCFYVYAHADDGYEFDHWEGHNNINGKTDAEYKFIFDNSTAGGTLPYTITAYFRKASGVIKRATNNNAGHVTLSKDDAMNGEEVTATAEMYPVGEGNINMMSEFSHWEDGNGEFLSDENPYTFEARPMTLTAIFTDRSAVPKVGKYYRVRNAYNRVLAIAGGFDWTPTIANADVPTALLRWAMPLDYDENLFNASWPISDAFEPLCPEASPATIIYVKEGNENDTGLTKVSLTAQGVNTYDITKQTLDIIPIFENYFGYYGIETTVGSNTAAFKALPRGDEGIINVTSPAYSSPVCAMAIQPIDEEHIDDFWFGALADEDMFFEDGYWTSMYASFPYKVYDEGVEAYYVTARTKEVEGTTYIYLVKIEDGVVPANSAVLLKCANPNDTKSNRLLPLNPDDVTIELEGNILKGEFQLYNSNKREGRVNFDESKMRVFGVSSEGNVGFYKLAPGTELIPNKAYLDLSKISNTTGKKAASYRLASGDTLTSVESIEICDNQNPEENIIFDLFGRRISNPQPGTIYIVNGKKVIWK